MAFDQAAIDQLINALKSQGGAVGKLKTQLEQLSEANLAAAKTAAELTTTHAEAVAALDAQIASNQRLTDALGRQHDALENEARVLSDIAAVAEKENEVREAKIDQLEHQIKLDPTLAGARQQQIDDLKEEIQLNNKRLPQLKKTSASMKDLGGSISKMLSGSAPDIDSMLNPKNIQGLVSKFKDLKKHPGGLKVAIGGMMKQAGAAAIAKLAVDIVKLARDLGNTENAFMRATNASRDFARNITLTYKEGRKFAMAAKDMTAAGVSLYNTFTDFTFIAPEAQREIVTATAALNKMGLSNQATAQTLQLMTKSFGMTGKEGVKTLVNLEKFAGELNVPLSKLGADYTAAGDTLSKLGANGDEAFRRLAKATKVTGLEMSKLLNVVNQFDTFEGAARSAGKLNAALGGNFVNAMDLMMETDPAARFDQIRDAILDTGLSFDEMSYYQRNFYKDALGLQSVGDLAQMLSGDMSSVTDETMKSEQEFKDLAEQARATATFQEQLNAVFAQMVPILTPLIDGFSWLLTVMSDNAELIKVLSGALMGFAVGGPVGAAIGALVMLFDTIEVGNEGLSFLEVWLTEIGAAWSNVGTAFAPFADMWNSWFPEVEGASDSLSGFDITLMAIAKALMTVTRVFALVIDAVALLGTGIGGLITGNWEPFEKAFGNFGNTVRAIIEPIMMLLNAIGLVSDKFEMLGFVMFEKSYASTFTQGIQKLTDVVRLLGAAWDWVGNKFSMASDWVTDIGNDWFGDEEKSLTVTPALKEAGDVAAKTASVSTSNVAARTTSVSAATDAVFSDFKNEMIKLQNAQPAGGVAANPEQNLTVNLMLDREKLATVMQRINGKEAQRDLSSYDT